MHVGVEKQRRARVSQYEIEIYLCDQRPQHLGSFYIFEARKKKDIMRNDHEMLLSASQKKRRCDVPWRRDDGRRDHDDPLCSYSRHDRSTVLKATPGKENVRRALKRDDLSR